MKARLEHWVERFSSESQRVVVGEPALWDSNGSLKGWVGNRYLLWDAPLGYASSYLTPSRGSSTCLESAYSTFHRDQVADQVFICRLAASPICRLDTRVPLMRYAVPHHLYTQHRALAWSSPARRGGTFGLNHFSFHWERSLAMTDRRVPQYRPA